MHEEQKFYYLVSILPCIIFTDTPIYLSIDRTIQNC